MVLMEKLNVVCEECKEGKLVSLDLVHDDYKVGCDTCNNVFWIHYTGFDDLQEQSEYNNMVSESVKLLTNNGVWVFDKRSKFSEMDLEEYTKDMKLIQTIQLDEHIHYYQDGTNFIRIIQNFVHSEFEIVKYRIEKVENLPMLMEHFFGKTV